MLMALEWHCLTVSLTMRLAATGVVCFYESGTLVMAEFLKHNPKGEASLQL
jgi:hypothetical protein